MNSSFVDLSLSIRSSVPGRRSIGCIGSKITFLCGVVCFSTCLTGWVDSFRISLSSVTVFVVIAIIVDLGVRIRVIGATVFVSRIIFTFFSLFSLFFQQATLISVTSCFITVVARWFGSVGIPVCGLLGHGVCL